jgi:hypothetical protein
MLTTDELIDALMQSNAFTRGALYRLSSALASPEHKF